MMVCFSRTQDETEFKVEVEAIGHVRHKNQVYLLGYRNEGTHRYSISLCSNIHNNVFTMNYAMCVYFIIQDIIL
ncbi:hypothetical protein Hanom_Chr03g00240301 [Helianthus anomalus]